MEQVAEAKILIAEMICDKCGKGKMKPAGEVLCSYPPLYPHVCKECGNKENYSTSYPCKRIIPIELFREPKDSEKGKEVVIIGKENSEK